MMLGAWCLDRKYNMREKEEEVIEYILYLLSWQISSDKAFLSAKK